MASLFKRKGSSNWQIRYYANGKEVFLSTNTPDRRKAEKARVQMAAKLEDGTYQKPSETPLATFLPAYLDHHRAKTCPDPAHPRKTYQTVVSRLRQFTKWLDKAHPELRTLEALATPVISEFLVEKRNTDKVSARTYNHYRQVIYTLVEYAIRHHGFVSRNPRHPNPVNPIERLPEPALEISYLDLDQIRQQLDALQTENLNALAAKNESMRQYRPWVYTVLRPMVATLIYAGLRREELLWLEPKDVDLAKGFIYVRAKRVQGEFWQPKTRKNRTVPVSSSLEAILSAYRPPKGSLWYFPSSAGVRWDTDGFSQALREINRLSGLSWQELDPETGKTIERHWGSLDFRHTFGSQCAMRGVSLFQISELMGNSPEICRKHYAHLAPESLRESVEFDTTATPSRPPRLRLIRSDDDGESGSVAMPVG